MPRRRRLLRAAGAAAAGTTLPLAGCLGEDIDNATPETSTVATPRSREATVDDRVVALTFERTTCEERGVTSATFEDDRFRAVGCLVETNGCRAAVLEAVYAPENEFLVRVGTASVTPKESPQKCPESYISTGYELQFQFRDDVPTRVLIVHDDVLGDETVRTIDRSNQL